MTFITKLRRIYPTYEPDSNGCLKFYQLLKEMYPHSRGWYDSDHIITEIDGEYYDIHGIAKKGRHIPIELYGTENMEQFTKV